jgi:hypothetical protein
MTTDNPPQSLVRAVQMAALAVRTLGTVAAGSLHARLFGFMSAADFSAVIAGLMATGAIESMPGGILRWVGNPSIRNLN